MILTKDKLTKRAGEMYPLVEKYLNTNGQTRAEFCLHHGLKKPQFEWWLKKYRDSNGITPSPKQQQPVKQFMPIELKTKESFSDSPSCKIEYPNGVQLQLHGQVDPSVILKLVQAGS